MAPVEALEPNPPRAGSNGSDEQARVPTDIVDSQDLLRGRKAVEIVHNGLVYRLQATRLGKLILTK